MPGKKTPAAGDGGPLKFDLLRGKVKRPNNHQPIRRQCRDEPGVRQAAAICAIVALRKNALPGAVSPPRAGGDR
jgi:hypothetical protein